MIWIISRWDFLPEREWLLEQKVKFVSSVSLWEAIIKHSLGKLPLPEKPEKYLVELREKHQFSSLPLDENSVRHLPELPSYHRDPFDRMLICQAKEHDLVIVTIMKCRIKIPTALASSSWCEVSMT